MQEELPDQDLVPGLLVSLDSNGADPVRLWRIAAEGGRTGQRERQGEEGREPVAVGHLQRRNQLSFSWMV